MFITFFIDLIYKINLIIISTSSFIITPKLKVMMKFYIVPTSQYYNKYNKITKIFFKKTIIYKYNKTIKNI